MLNTCLAFFGLLVILSGCGKLNAGKDTTFAPFSVCTSNPQNTVQNILGTWTSPCSAWQFYNGAPVSSLTDTLTFSGTTVVETISIYADAQQCYPSTKQSTTVVTGTFALGGQSTLNALNNMNITISQITVTPLSSYQESAFNTASYCGISDWSSGISRNVAGINTGECTFPASGSVILQAFGLGNTNAQNPYPTLCCGTPVNGAAFGKGPNSTPTSGVIVSGSTSQAPTDILGRIFFK